MRRVLVSSLLLVLTATVLGCASARTKTECGVSLVLPPTWTLGSPEKQSYEDACTLGLAPAGWPDIVAGSEEQIDNSAIFIGVTRGTLDEAACDAFIACRNEHGWFSRGRGGATNALREERQGDRIILAGFIEAGKYRKGGGYLGMKQGMYAVVSSRGRLITILASSDFKDKALFRQFVLDVKADGAPPN